MKIERVLPDRTISLYQDGRLNELLNGFRKAVQKHNTTAVIIGDGRSGMGKTTLMVQLGISLDPNFSLQKIHFIPKTFLEGDETGKIGLANAKKGDFILFDEAMLISNRNAMTQINKMIIQAMSMIRSKNIYVGFCVNSIFDLDRNLVLHRADLLLHLYGTSLVDRGRFAAFFKGRDGIDRLKILYIQGKKTYSYSKPHANFVGKFTKEFVIDEKEYEIEKQMGVNEFLKSNQGKFFDKDKVILKLKALNFKIVDIADVIGYSRQRVQEILKMYKVKIETPES